MGECKKMEGEQRRWKEWGSREHKSEGCEEGGKATEVRSMERRKLHVHVHVYMMKRLRNIFIEL